MQIGEQENVVADIGQMIEARGGFPDVPDLDFDILVMLTRIL